MAAKLICKNIYAVYGNKEILNNVSLDVAQGEFVCLYGLNGSGKSTILSLMAGLESPELNITSSQLMPSIQSGNNNILISSLSRKECAKYISFMQQNEYSMWDFSVYDFVLQGRFPYSRKGIYGRKDYRIVDAVIDELHLNGLRERNVHSLSGGEMQKVKIARAIVQEPYFLLLDEPSSNLDIVFEPKLLKLLKDLTKAKNIGILISIHDINITSDIADKVYLLSHDGVISGSYDDVVNTVNLKKTFGEDFQCRERKYFQLLQ